MRTISLFLCAFLVAYGFWATVFEANFAGFVLMIIGAVSFLVIAKETKKIAGYDKKHFMNR